MRINYQPLKDELRSKSPEERQHFASQCGTTFNYLKKRMYLGQPLGFQIAIKLVELNIMTPQQLRPTDWQNYNWQSSAFMKPVSQTEK